MDWSALLPTFGLLFVAELGDKTQLAVVAQTCKFRRPLPVFLGASLSLALITALGVIGGQALTRFIPEGVLRAVATAGFVVMGGLIWREATRPQEADDAEAANACETDSGAAWRGFWDWKAFGSTLALLFVAELGDKTQLAVLAMTSRQAAPWAVFTGAALALTGVTALGVIGGQQLCRLVPERLLLRISAVAFVVMGALMGFGVL